MGTYIKDTTCKKSQPSPVGIRLKAELKKKETGLFAKEFCGTAWYESFSFE